MSAEPEPPVEACPDCGAAIVATVPWRLEIAPPGEGDRNARLLAGPLGAEWRTEAPADTADCAYRMHAHQPEEPA